MPSLWSLREMWPGDNYHLALAYFEAGLADDGWTVLSGTFPLMAFYGPVPGDLGNPNGGTDFNDCAAMFCRAVVEGLFGYRPDYPNAVVTIAPQLPAAWDHASIKTPDVSLEIGRTKYRIELAQPAALDLRLPVRARRLVGATVNCAAAKWELLPGVGYSVAKIAVPKCRSATVELAIEQPLPQYAAVSREINPGAKLDLPTVDARVIEPAVLPASAGYHLVESLVQTGDTPQRRLYKIRVKDPAAEAAEAARTFVKPPADARWRCVDLKRQFNGDIRTIFQQQYLSPRPNTCSLRLASNGYSTWQMSLGKGPHAPTIDLAGVPRLLDSTSRLRTPQGVPFAWMGANRNIVFTSMWDNWPRQVAVPINRKGEAIWFLVCGFTNPMQGRTVNAELRMKYADGAVDRLELVPPLNFWSLCPFGGADYDYKRDAFCLPKIPPKTVQLGSNCRAILLNQRLRPGVVLESVTLETALAGSDHRSDGHQYHESCGVMLAMRIEPVSRLGCTALLLASLTALKAAETTAGSPSVAQAAAGIGIPSLDEMAGDWIPMRNVANPPAVHNFNQMLVVGRDLTSCYCNPGGLFTHTKDPGVQWTAGYPLVKITINGIEYPAAETRWYAYRALRRNAACGDVALETDTRMVNEQRSVLCRITAANNTQQPQTTRLTLRVPGSLQADGVGVSNSTQRKNVVSVVRPSRKPDSRDGGKGHRLLELGGRLAVGRKSDAGIRGR